MRRNGESLQGLINDLSFVDNPKWDRIPQIYGFVESLRAMKKGFEAERALLEESRPAPVVSKPVLPVFQVRPDLDLVNRIKAEWAEKKANGTLTMDDLAPSDPQRRATINVTRELQDLRDEYRKFLR